MRTLDKIITKVGTRYGAPVGRPSKGLKPNNKKIYDCKVPMNGSYDKGGAYWGLNNKETLRVSYTKDLSFVFFYWK